ncbi:MULTISPECIES: gluconokinase [Amycolatopsis]|uniref:Gluconokinase n=1 Tax=Amycolatopsis dendrobii TaxID=2760662 RepID=A0A7W3ZG37_9PSEU|nr:MULTISPECIES: gluconokinase [Amycolatopsis]MBB1159674.1 gluconokinase [Amycolatopsis dendrobii]UKD54359.1 gluconokinase [Amycolatopsis sp. FU40]
MTVIVVMGVSGSGKTTVGKAVAEELGVEYAEADTFHPQANIEKMTAGHPLTDEDREPWLAAIALWIAEHQESGGVVSSSALKRRYRDVLRGGWDVWFLHLHGSRDLLAERMKTRSGHFMPVSLLDSQLADLEPLEPDEPGETFDISLPPADLVESALTAFRKSA